MAFRITALLTALLFATPSVAQPAPVEPRRLFLGPVTEEGIAPLMKGLREAIANHEDIVYIEIDSPGGSVSAGLQLQALMRKAEKAGVETVCLVDGHAASMAGFLLQECDVRMMTRRSDILYHEVSITFPDGGTEWDLRRIADSMSDLNQRLAIFICGRINVSLSDFLARTHGRDWWLGWEAALATGSVDVVVD